MKRWQKVFLVSLSIAAFALSIVFAVFYTIQKQKTLVNTDTLNISTKGSKMAVNDRAGGEQYNFIFRKAKQGERKQAPQVETDTGTVKIVILPCGEIEITDKTAGTVYRFRKKSLFKQRKLG